MSNGAYRLAPWTVVASPHEDVRSGALDMGTYAANLAGVFRRRPGVPDVYTRPELFFAATYLTTALHELLLDVLPCPGWRAGRPGLAAPDPVRRRQDAYPGGSAPPRPRPRRISVTLVNSLICPTRVRFRWRCCPARSSTRLASMSASGVETRTLWGELAAQLGRYDLVAEHDRPGPRRAVRCCGRCSGTVRCLCCSTKCSAYVEKAMAVERGESSAGRQAMLFIQALTEAVNTYPRAAMVYSLQASVGEAVGAEGLLMQLDHLVSRIDAKREPISGDEVMRVVQRRLFADLGDVDVHRTVARAYAELLAASLRPMRRLTTRAWRPSLTPGAGGAASLAAYPFHPELLDLMYHRWGSLPSYQRTRGALQFLACTVHALWKKSADGPLIGPGEVDLADEATRGAFFSQVGERERYTSVLSSDITAGGSGAITVDRRLGADSPALAQLAIGSRAATAIMLYSFGAREGEDRGVLEADLCRGDPGPRA